MTISAVVTETNINASVTQLSNSVALTETAINASVSQTPISANVTTSTISASVTGVAPVSVAVSQTNISASVSGGGSGGVTDHALLTNLDYASAGHTGFQSTLTADVDYLTPATAAATYQTIMTFPVAPNLGGTGIANAAGSTLTLGGATTIPAPGGTVALLAAPNVFTGVNSFTRGTDSTNLFLGGGGNATTTGTKNIALGVNTLPALTDGIRNTAIGYDALKVNTTGYSNVAIGDAAMLSNVDGYYNMAIGVQALKENISGTRNVAVGLDALQYNTASNNVALGYQAANKNTSGSNNMAIGTAAMFTNTTGLNNIAIGYNALYLNDTTSQNVAIGSQALENNIASNNIAIGYNAGQAITSGTPNIAIGSLALDVCQTGTFNTAIGSGSAGKATGGFNTAIGASAMANNVAGISNTAIGVSAMASGSGSRNVIIGCNAGFYETGSDKLFIDNASRTSEAIARETSFLYGSMAAGGQLQLNIGTTTNNAVKEVFRIQSYVSTAATGSANGFGAGYSIYAETATDGTYQQQGFISASWIDATNATRKAKLSLSAYDTAQRLGLEIQASGSAAMLGVLGATPIVRQAHIIDADGTLADVTSKFNSLLAYLENFGFIATS